jgi:hypothetical protein
MNEVEAQPVGGVSGIYNMDRADSLQFIHELSSSDLNLDLVPYATQMHKVEINQINTLLARMYTDGGPRA